MKDATILEAGGRSLGHFLPSDQLAALIASRLCHDLISPIGAIGNGLELLHFSPQVQKIAHSPEVQLIADSVAAARSRINWFRVAFGQATPKQNLAAAAFKELLDDADCHGRMRIRCELESDLPRIEARLILLSLMCLESAMPWGGRVRVCRSENRWRLVAEAERIKHDTILWGWLDHDAVPRLPMPAPSDIHFALLATCLRNLDCKLHWELGETGGEISFCNLHVPPTDPSIR